ncbi:MAG: class I SAM-dependent methyltransferase [Planctomycetota bacterium]
MSFDVSADAYDRFMGRYSRGLAAPMADLAGVRAGQRVLDVGCGAGALTAELVARVGPERVSAVDPSPRFVEAVALRQPGAEVRLASAEALPFADACYDASLAQLVVHFLSDPVAGLAEMARVTRPGGVVAACVWDLAAGGGPLSTFWGAVRGLDPQATDESRRAGAREGHLVELLVQAGLSQVQAAVLSARVEHPSFEDWWEPYTLGVGPAGAFVAALEPGRREELRARCQAALPAGPFAVTARAWAARGVVA